MCNRYNTDIIHRLKHLASKAIDNKLAIGLWVGRGGKRGAIQDRGWFAAIQDRGWYDRFALSLSLCFGFHPWPGLGETWV